MRRSGAVLIAWRSARRSVPLRAFLEHRSTRTSFQTKKMRGFCFCAVSFMRADAAFLRGCSLVRACAPWICRLVPVSARISGRKRPLGCQRWQASGLCQLANPSLPAVHSSSR